MNGVNSVGVKSKHPLTFLKKCINSFLKKALNIMWQKRRFSIEKNTTTERNILFIR